MNAFLARMYDRRLEHGDPRIRIRELDGIQRRLAGNRPGLCTLAGGCLGNYYLVNPNGDVQHCDLFIGDERYTFGNVLTHTFADFRASQNMLDRQAENERTLVAMQTCPEFAVCNGWCPHERYISARHNLNHQAGCCGLRPLIEHIRSRMQERDLGATA